MAGVGVHFVGLAGSTAGDEFSDEGGHAGPPIVPLQEGDCAEVSAMGAGKGFVNVFNEGVTGGFGNVEVASIIKSALVEIPVLRGGTR